MIRRLAVAGCAVAASVVIAAPLAAQTGVLSGVIYDQTNKTGLAGAEVRIKGTDLVAISGKDGRFTIVGIPEGSREVETVRAGYRPFRLPSVKVAASDTAHIYLALSAIPEERVEAEQPVRDITVVDGIITGKVTKLTLGEISENAPMYIVDGVILSARTTPKDIEGLDIVSIEVVKGAAAQQMYGERGANGVIVVTTRRIP